MGTKTVADKLLIRPETTVWFSDRSRLNLIGPLPEGVRVVDKPEEATTAVVFADDAAAAREVLAANKSGLTAADALWVAYPKSNRTDINRDSLWPILSEHGMRPISQVAIDDVWSALRFRVLKEGEAPFTAGQ